MKNFIIIAIVAVCSLQLTAQTQTASATVINFKKLQGFLPTTAPEGFSRQKPKGQTASSGGISSSTASVEFVAQKKIKELQTMDDGKQDSVDTEITLTATIEIADYAGLGEGMSATLQAMVGMEFENETEEGYEKSVKFKDYKGIEKVSSLDNSHSCSIQLVVGNRFLVNTTGSNFSDITILHSLLNAMDLKKLEEVK